MFRFFPTTTKFTGTMNHMKVMGFTADVAFSGTVTPQGGMVTFTDSATGVAVSTVRWTGGDTVAFAPAAPAAAAPVAPARRSGVRMVHSDGTVAWFAPADVHDARKDGFRVAR